jgi:hypothetical protein
VRVYNDDPVKKVAYLSIQANIIPYIRIRPKSVALRGMSSEVKTTEVFITGNLEEPLKIEADSFSLMGKVKYEIETVEEGKQYKVRFENLTGLKGSYSGYLKMKTSYPENPDIKIKISSRFK